MLESDIVSLRKTLYAIVSRWSPAVYPSWWPNPIKDLQIEPQKAVFCVAEIDIGRCLVHTKEDHIAYLEQYSRL